MPLREEVGGVPRPGDAVAVHGPRPRVLRQIVHIEVRQGFGRRGLSIDGLPSVDNESIVVDHRHGLAPSRAWSHRAIHRLLADIRDRVHSGWLGTTEFTLYNLFLRRIKSEVTTSRNVNLLAAEHILTKTERVLVVFRCIILCWFIEQIVETLLLRRSIQSSFAVVLVKLLTVGIAFRLILSWAALGSLLCLTNSMRYVQSEGNMTWARRCKP